MKTLLRLIGFEFKLIRILLFRQIFERITNTLTAAVAGFFAIYYFAFASRDVYEITPTPENLGFIQAMVFFAFLYAETIMANWQYTTNKTGRMELIFNSTQAPLKIIFAKTFTSACITLASMIALYIIPATWFGLSGAFSLNFWIAAIPTLLVCTSIMCFNALFEFKLKQVKALTATINLVLPYMAIQFATQLPKPFDILPYFATARFLSKTDNYTITDIAWLCTTSIITATIFLLLSQLLVTRIRSTASVYLD
jgi:hypothetical protein